MREWLSQLHAQGKKDYARIDWPAHADSPLQRNYTVEGDFEPGKYAGGAKAKTKISLKTKGGAQACTLAELKGKDLGLFKEKFGKILGTRAHRLIALKNSFLENGFLVCFPDESEGSVEITCGAQGGVAGMHGIVIVGKNAKAGIVQKQAGHDALVAEATEVYCGEGSTLAFDYEQNAALDCSVFTAKKAALRKNARLIWNSALFGAKTTSATIDSSLEGEGAHAENYNAYFGKEKQCFDVSTNSYHSTANTSGNVLSKGVLAGEAQATYRGLIYIAKQARGTNCFLNGHALLLSEKAKANSVPSLEIHTNDVQSRHGATVDQIDSEKIFYLQTRGLSKKQATQTIVEGFVGEALEKSDSALNGWRQIISEKMQDV